MYGLFACFTHDLQAVDVTKLFFNYFEKLPLRVKVTGQRLGRSFLCVHGGFPHPDQDPEDGILWNDPKDDLPEPWARSKRGSRYKYWGKEITTTELNTEGMLNAIFF